MVFDLYHLKQGVGVCLGGMLCLGCRSMLLVSRNLPIGKVLLLFVDVLI